jgi:hypothetical protein
MDGTPGIQRVVEIQRMTHAGIQQRCLRRRQADPPQQDAAFSQPAPARDRCKELVNPREPLPPSMQPKVSRISRRADSTTFGGKSAQPVRQTCWARGQAASSVIIFSHRLRCSDITCCRGPSHATATAIGDQGLGLRTIVR